MRAVAPEVSIRKILPRHSALWKMPSGGDAFASKRREVLHTLSTHRYFLSDLRGWNKKTARAALPVSRQCETTSRGKPRFAEPVEPRQTEQPYNPKFRPAGRCFFPFRRRAPMLRRAMAEIASPGSERGRAARLEAR